MFARVNLIARLLILIELHHRVNVKIRVLNLDVEIVKYGLLHLRNRLSVLWGLRTTSVRDAFTDCSCLQTLQQGASGLGKAAYFYFDCAWSYPYIGCFLGLLLLDLLVNQSLLAQLFTFPSLILNFFLELLELSCERPNWSILAVRQNLIAIDLRLRLFLLCIVDLLA